MCVAWKCYLVILMCSFHVEAGYPNARNVQQIINPVAFYGYRRSQHSIVGSIHTATIHDSMEITCPSQLTVRVHKAIVLDKDGGDSGIDRHNNNCTEHIRAQCLERKSCMVSVPICMEALAGVKSSNSELVIQYSCEPSGIPRPLYNGTYFLEGLSNDFLVIKGDRHDATSNQDILSLQSSLRSCMSRPDCQYVTCSDGKHHAEDYFLDGNTATCAYLKPDRFKMPGYAVYINFTGLCRRPKRVKSQDFYEVAKLAKPKSLSFSIAYEPTSQFGLPHERHSWMCPGIPTIVPMAGHVVAIPAMQH